MAVNILDELTKKLQEGKQKEMGLTDRLNYLDNYNKDVAVPQISSEGPKGYNPVNSLNALFQMISNRKAVSQDVTNASNSNLDVLGSIADYQSKTAPKEVDPLKLLELQIKAKEAGMKFDPETMSLGEDKTKSKASEDVLNVVDQLMGRSTGEISGMPNVKAFIPGTDTQLTKNLFDQLKGMLALENRQKLKGSGQISDYESKVLDKAASALGRNLSDTDFKKVLEDLRKGLSGEEDTKVGDFTIKAVK
jgi:hypothetical protein